VLGVFSQGDEDKNRPGELKKKKRKKNGASRKFLQGGKRGGGRGEASMKEDVPKPPKELGRGGYRPPWWLQRAFDKKKLGEKK